MPKKPNLPATTGPKPGAVAKQEQVKLINILKDDHQFDIVKEIIDHIGMIKRSKKTKTTEKHRLLANYYMTLLQYCMPKMKLTEDKKDDGKPIKFEINVPIVNHMPGAQAVKNNKGVSITIPTVKNSNGSYAVTPDKE